MADQPRLKVSPWFPNAPSACRKPANEFFECFTEHSQQEAGVRDPDAGQRGLQACVAQMKKYDECMERFTKKKPLEHYRVEEAYRKEN